MINEMVLKTVEETLKNSIRMGQIIAYQHSVNV